ncbi:hypothetical protein QFZ74_002469 [Streptomyces sp. V3I7]|nr:hypothetical protein [Streptomyces sp. V3I7]
MICFRSARSVSRSISTWIPGLDVRVVREVGAVGRGGQHLDELAGEIAPDDELRVDDDVDAAPLPGQLVADRVDEEGHVVGDDLDDGVAAGPPVLLDRRGVHPDVRGALRARLSEAVVRECGSEDVDRVAAFEVLRSGVQVVAPEEREYGLLVRGLRRSRSALTRRPSR